MCCFKVKKEIKVIGVGLVVSGILLHIAEWVDNQGHMQSLILLAFGTMLLLYSQRKVIVYDDKIVSGLWLYKTEYGISIKDDIKAFTHYTYDLYPVVTYAFQSTDGKNVCISNFIYDLCGIEGVLVTNGYSIVYKDISGEYGEECRLDSETIRCYNYRIRFCKISGGIVICGELFLNAIAYMMPSGISSYLFTMEFIVLLLLFRSDASLFVPPHDELEGINSTNMWGQLGIRTEYYVHIQLILATIIAIIAFAYYDPHWDVTYGPFGIIYIGLIMCSARFTYGDPDSYREVFVKGILLVVIVAISVFSMDYVNRVFSFSYEKVCDVEEYRCENGEGVFTVTIDGEKYELKDNAEQVMQGSVNVKVYDCLFDEIIVCNNN